jgi:hypothetical protein
MGPRLEMCGYFEMRRRNNPYSLENFEFLYDGAMDWYENVRYTISDKPPSSSGAASGVGVKVRSALSN